MKVLLEDLLPKLYPDLRFLCLEHEGKQDLEKSIPRKLKAWREPGVHFVVLRDNDGADCREVKKRLVELCAAGDRPETLVRIVCQELEAWYFGDPEAVAAAFEKPALADIGRKARFRDPDTVQKPSVALEELEPAFQKVSGARKMAPVMTRDNRSRSFQVFLSGVDRLVSSMQQGAN